MLRKLHLALAIGSITVLIFSFCGFAHPIGDSLAVFQLPFGFLFLIIVLSLRSGRIFKLGALVLLLTAMVQIAHRVKYDDVRNPQIRVYQKNLSFRIRDVGPLAEDILAKGDVDFITFQEVTDRNSGVMTNLADSFPTQHTCPFAGVGGTAVLSRWPVIEGTKMCFDRDGASAMKVNTDNGEFWIISVHLNWPYPYRQAEQVKRLSPRIQKLEGPKIVAGDFNMVPWSYTMHRVAKDAQAKRVGKVEPTFDLPGIPMGVAIDHVLSPKNTTGATYVRPKFGSDHYGLIAHISLGNED